MKKLLLIFLSVLLFAACKKVSFPVYHTKPDIYFSNHDAQYYTYWYTYFDSVRYSFSDHPDLNEDSIMVTVRIAGDTAGTDRPFLLSIDKDASSAVEGQDYQLPESSKLVIPRDGVETSFYVKVIKSDALLEKPATLVMKLMPNNFFDTLILDQKESYYNDVILPATRFKIVIDNVIPEPTFWKQYTNFLGDYSPQKYLLLLKVNDLKLTDDISTLGPSYFKGVAAKTQAYLNGQAAAGNIIKESDGSVMVMGPDVQ